MLSILKEKKKLFLSLLLIWTLTAIYVVPRRYEILRSFTLWIEPPELNPKLSEQLQERGDELLSEKVTFHHIDHFIKLGKMSESCYRAMEIGRHGLDELFREPSWMEARKKGWTMQDLIPNESPLLGSDFNRERIDTTEYWQEYSRTVLEALDDYKRALNFNPFDGYNRLPGVGVFGTDRPSIYGKSLLEKITMTSYASCRPEEALVSHFHTLTSIEDLVFEKIKRKEKPQIPWWKKILNFFSFSCSAEPDHILEAELPREIRVWEAISKSDSNPIVFSEDYPERTKLSANQFKQLILKTLDLLGSAHGNGSSSLSPEESVSLYLRILYFSCSNRSIPPEAKYWGSSAIAMIPCVQSDEEGNRLFYTNEFRLARLYYKLADRESSYRKIAGELFEKVYQSKSTSLGIRFQAKLMRIRCLMYASSWDQSLKELDQLQNDLYSVDPEFRSDKAGYEDLIEDRKKLLQFVLRKKGKYSEADDLFDETTN
ncbi:hypothetical protein CH373_10415 [Leptospira perolatii]|uniref:Uncharacterized protein n=1 Tax=Leptospira perolatii TaxID=2023191 RepID=A0A2M9ZMR8_9LEPT|nr:hypothetical protein [Leptospira perolatii]PJZ68283.1 hypothetical protein CH360_17055 [Leptospira perolatii]PJZ73366.1 hypothetical protein CH373_10415 [Leptospira perolatii]